MPQTMSVKRGALKIRGNKISLIPAGLARPKVITVDVEKVEDKSNAKA